MIAGADPIHTKALYDYGDAIGIAFQIVDDFLDYGGTEAIGKNIGDDFREGKPTLPLIKTIAADRDASEFWKRVIEKHDQRDGDLEEALSRMAATGALEQTKQDAMQWADRARNALDPLPQHPIKDHLNDLADYVVRRLV